MMKFKLCFLALSAFALVGCRTLTGPNPDDPAFAPIPPESMIPPPNRTGGIYQDGYSMAFFETIRARRIGDIITITLDEKTNASKGATTKTSKKYDGKANFSNVWDTTPAITDAAALASDREFNGEGTSKQNNSLSGSITATVYGMLPNGNMMVRGEKWVSLNQGNEYIRIRGMVRPVDISPDNTVSSQRIADARISYGGTGQLSDANTMGWLTRFFNSVIFPF